MGKVGLDSDEDNPLNQQLKIHEKNQVNDDAWGNKKEEFYRQDISDSDEEYEEG